MPKQILIVDDNPLNRRLFEDILTYHGYLVAMAGDGLEGVSMAARLRPDLILMDIQMPVLDGFGALARLRENPDTRNMKVIALTAQAMRGDRERILAAGFAGYLAKPINSHAFVRAVAESLAEDTP